MIPKRKILLILAILFLLALPLAVILQSILAPSPSMPPVTIPISQNPQMKSPDYFNPSWWNTSFRYRTEVNFTEQNGIARTNNLVDVYLTFEYGTCYNNTIVVPQYRYNTSGPWITNPIPCQVWNRTYYPSTSYLASATITFYVNVTASETATYYVYYNNSATSWMPSFPNTVTYTLVGSEYVFDTAYYQANCSGSKLGGKLYNVYNKISGTWWTSQPATSNGFHWNPDYPNYDSTSRYPPVAYGILTNGSLFVMYSSLARLGGTITAYTNITYRFFEWGWICETNSTFNQSYGAALYRNNEWVFNDKIMPGAAYKASSGTVYSYSTFSEWWNRDIGRAFWLCFFDSSDKEAMGTVDLVEPSYAGITTSGWSYRLWQPSSTYYQYWDRAWPSTAVTVGGYIYERFANYIWDGSAGYSVFQTFAEMMEKDHTLTINVNSTQQRVFFDLNITVMDYFDNPLKNVAVTIYNTNSWSPSDINTSRTTDSQGTCLFQLFEKTGGYWIEANITTSYKTYTWRSEYAWVPGENSSALNINMNITTLYLSVKDFYGVPAQMSNVSVNYTSGSLTNITNQSVDQYYADLLLYVYADEEVNITIRTNYGTPRDENFTLWNMNESKYEGTQSGLGRIVTMNSSKFFIATLNRSIGQATPYLWCENGTLFTDIYWSDNFTFRVWIKSPGGAGIEADWVNYTIYALNGTILYGPVNMTRDSLYTGLWNATFNTTTIGLLFGGESYIITITAKPTDTASYSYPLPLNLYITPLNSLPLEILPYSTQITVTWNETPAFTIDCYLNDTHHSVPVTGAPLQYSISPGGYSGYMTDDGSGNYSIPTSVLELLSVDTYTVTLSLSWENRSASSSTINLQINSIPTVLETLLVFEGNWGENITIYAVYKRTSPNATVDNASIYWNVKGTEISGLLTSIGNGNYTGQIDTTLLNATSYTLVISAGKPNYASKDESVTLTISGTPTVFGDPLVIPPIASSPIIYIGPYIQLENWIPMIPVIFYYHTTGPHSPVSGANVTLTIGPLTFNLVEVMPGVYMTLIPTFNLPPGNYFGIISASYTNYQFQQSPLFISVTEPTILIPISNTKVPRSTFLIAFSAVAIPVAVFISYVSIKRARIPAIVKRIDALIKSINRGEKITVKLIPREVMINKIISQELATIGLEPKLERYIPVALADLIVPLLVESGMKPDEAYALTVELKTAIPQAREKLLESVGIPGEISAKIIKTIEEEEEKKEILKKPRKTKTKKPEEEEEELKKPEEEEEEEEEETPTEEEEEELKKPEEEEEEEEEETPTEEEEEEVKKPEETKSGSEEERVGEEKEDEPEEGNGELDSENSASEK